MADGNVVPSRAVWHGKMKLGNIEVEGEFEVFDSKGSWEFLLGKPLLRLFGAKQDFLTDTVTICGDNGSSTTVLHNEITQQKPSTEVVTMNLTANAKQTAISMGGPDMPEPPAREVPQLFETERTNASKTESTDLPQPVYLTAEKGADPNSVLTRETDPWKPEHVARILQEVTVGPDITKEQRQIVQEILTEFADCFALSIKEVNVIPGAVHKLNIPESATFRTKLPPRAYNPDQRAFMEAKVTEMLEARIFGLSTHGTFALSRNQCLRKKLMKVKDSRWTN